MRLLPFAAAVACALSGICHFLALIWHDPLTLNCQGLAWDWLTI
jgi:hypothetical protein